MSFVVPARFCGPPESGNGGWVSGHAASLLSPGRGQAVTVRLRTPPPLDRELAVDRFDGSLRVLDGDRLVLEASIGAAPDAHGIPAPVSFAEAEVAGERYEGLAAHPFPNCYSCGTVREPGDALRLQPGPVDGGLYACAWVPSPDAGLETLWAALDCPGGWASGIAGRPMVLGTMTATVHAMPVPGEPHVIMAWQRGSEGRKHLSGTAVYAAGGELLGHAEATWIAVDPDTVRPLGENA